MSERDEAIHAAVENFKEPKHPFVVLTFNPGDHTCDNGILFSATYLGLLEQIYLFEAAWFMGLVRATEVSPGLYHRYPGWPDLNSHDNLIGVAFGAWRCKLPFAKHIVAHGRRNFWAWNNAEPGKWTARSCLRRLPGVWPFLKVAAGEKLNWLEQLEVAGALIANTFEKREETSGKCLRYLMNRVMLGKYKLIDWAIRYWKRKLREKYPRGMKDIYGIYFGKAHPFYQFAREDFE